MSDVSLNVPLDTLIAQAKFTYDALVLVREQIAASEKAMADAHERLVAAESARYNAEAAHATDPGGATATNGSAPDILTMIEDARTNMRGKTKQEATS